MEAINEEQLTPAQQVSLAEQRIVVLDEKVLEKLRLNKPLGKLTDQQKQFVEQVKRTNQLIAQQNEY
jgi:hypothetical protein